MKTLIAVGLMAMSMAVAAERVEFGEGAPRPVFSVPVPVPCAPAEDMVAWMEHEGLAEHETGYADQQQGGILIVFRFFEAPDGRFFIVAGYSNHPGLLCRIAMGWKLKEGAEPPVAPETPTGTGPKLGA